MTGIDLFTDVKGRIAIHITTGTIVIMHRSYWYKNQLSHDVLVPQLDRKGKRVFCHATYSDEEIEITNEIID